MQESSGMLLTESSNDVELKTVKVAVGVPLSRSFDYLPAGDLERYKPGSRVVVPFGRSTRVGVVIGTCLLYTSPSPRDKRQSRMPSSA